MKKRGILLGLGVLILYNIVTGGGIVIIRKDSMASLGQVVMVELMEEASVYLKESPTTRIIPIPFLVYYVRQSYPFRLRFYGSTRDGSIRVSDRPLDKVETNVVVTEVRYYRELDPLHNTEEREVFRAQSWNEIVIPEPGVWKVESEGYVRYGDGHMEGLTFPTMTIRPTESGRFQVDGFLSFFLVV